MCFVCGYKIVDFCDFAKVVANIYTLVLNFFQIHLKYLEKRVLFLMCLIRDKMLFHATLPFP